MDQASKPRRRSEPWVEALREELKRKSRGEARAIALQAKLKPSTVEKFRLGWITEPSLDKLRKLQTAMEAA